MMKYRSLQLEVIEGYDSQAEKLWKREIYLPKRFRQFSQ